jgi:hypothetical protein
VLCFGKYQCLLLQIPRIFSLGNDTSLCPDSEISFDITAPFEDMEYFWSNGSRTPTQTLPAKHGVTYWVKATNKVCETTDSIHVKVRSVPNNFIGNDTAICEGSDLKLSVLNDDRIKGYEWKPIFIAPTNFLEPLKYIREYRMFTNTSQRLPRENVDTAGSVRIFTW